MDPTWTSSSHRGLDWAPQSGLAISGAEGATKPRLPIGVATVHPIDALRQRIELLHRPPGLRRAALPLAARRSLRGWLSILQARALGSAVIEEVGEIAQVG